MSMEESLEQSKKTIERLKSALQESISGIIVFDFDGTIQFVNNQWAELHGYTREEVLSKNFSLFFSAKEQPKIQQALEKAKKEGKCIVETLTKRKDGKQTFLLIRFILSKNDNQEPIGFVGSGRDISEQKEREKKLERQKMELERSNTLMQGRELRMVELKKEINTLLKQLGKKPRYGKFT